MGKISINLLPGEVVVLEKDRRKRSFLTRLSIGVLVVMILITSGILGYRLLQDQSVDKSNQDLAAAKANVASYKDQEGLLVFLKGRLTSIRSAAQKPSKEALSYELITSLIPQSMDILSLSVDKSGNILLTTEASDDASMQQFFDNLISPETNKGQITKVKIESLNKGQGSLYRMDLTITVI